MKGHLLSPRRNKITGKFLSKKRYPSRKPNLPKIDKNTNKTDQFESPVASAVNGQAVMGASTSTEQNLSAEQREVENVAASTGALPVLQISFSKLADPQTNLIPLESLKKCFCFSYKNPTCEGTLVPELFPAILDHVGLSIVDLLFVSEKGGVGWVEFLNGYIKCCGRMSSSELLKKLLRIFDTSVKKIGLTSTMVFESDEEESKISGFLMPKDVLNILWICWTMTWDVRASKSSFHNKFLFLPDIDNLVRSAVTSCAEVAGGVNSWECNVLDLEVQVPVEKLLAWALKVVPFLPDCFREFVHARLQNPAPLEDGLESSSSSAAEISIMKPSAHLLTCGTAWAISLTMRSSVSEEMLKICIPDHSEGTLDYLLYRSSLHGRGMNRFWSNIEGYQGPMLVLVSATLQASDVGGTSGRKWTIAALALQGFENRDQFYGSSGNLYAISPVFHVFSPSGKEKNFVYSHLHPSGRVYEPHPKPVGIGFGGTVQSERIFIDEDFDKVTIRHHAVDKTYSHGSLFPDQGFLPVETSISEVEVWALGGKAAKKVQNSYKKREELFTEQRRKVDLKTFANWEESPEKMMMDMVSDPSTVRREDR